MPEQGRGTRDGIRGRVDAGENLNTESMAARRRNEHEDENTKMKDRKQGEDRRDDNERTGSDLSKTVGSREGAVTRIEEKRNGATRLPGFDEARQGGLNTCGGGRYKHSKTTYKGEWDSE
jgi:hypothetical protein